MMETSGIVSNEISAHFFVPNPNNDIVSTMHRCETEMASKLCIFEAHNKLQTDGHYDIGGTYLNDEADFWFHFTTTACPKQSYICLLNLFVKCKSPRNFSIGISDSGNVIVPEMLDKCLILKDNLKWYSFRSVSIKENHYVKTFCFTKNNFHELKSLLIFIPISIRSETELVLNQDLIKSIKLQHNLTSALIKQEKSDILLKSADGNTFPAHKVVLAAHSSNIIDEERDSLFIDISDDEMNLLLEFMYTGTIKDLDKQNSKQLLQIAKKFKVPTLCLLAQIMLRDQINVDNVIEIAVLANKLKLDELLYKAAEFIKSHPEVMKTTAWMELNDVKLVKYFFEHMSYNNK